MSRVVTKVSLGIAVCLSSFLWGSQSSNAVSLKIGDRPNANFALREELLTPEEKFLSSSNFLFTVDSFEPSFSIQQDNQTVLDDAIDNNLQLSRLFLLDNQQLSSLYSTEKASIFESATTLFSNAISDNQNQAEDVNLLSYFAEAVDNIEISLDRVDTSNSEITVLSQTSLQNIYEDVYSSEIDLSAPASLETVNNLISSSSTTPNESLSDSASSSNLVFFQYSPYISNVSDYNNSSVSSSSLSNNNINSLINRKAGDDLSSRVNGLILKPANIFTNIPEIESQSRFNFKRNNSGVKKDPRMQEVEAKMSEERERRQREREKLREKLRREQQQRSERRKRDQERIERERKAQLRNQIRQQKRRMREQRNRFR